MRTIPGAICLAACLLAPPVTRAQESFSFDLSLDSPEFPDLDANPIIRGEAGEEFLFTAEMILSSSGLIEEGNGPQGWSWATWHAGLDVVSLSVEGTVSARESDGGFLDDDKINSFIQYETIDPARNEGREGVIQAVVLTFRHNTMLPPNTRQITGRNVYRARIDSPGTIAFLRHEEGLVGSGQPIQNVITIGGQTRHPSLAHREITIGENAVAEDCEDGLDNDRDGWTDCADPSCRNTAACGAEVCTDGVDNDADGLIDCADPDCQRSESCREICDDGVDNDRDGRADCLDSECVGHPSCPDPEVCDDGVDNDEDGLTDCADPQCSRTPACRVPEDCEDGVDNDEDGRTDCDDRECFGVGPCPFPEVCDDGIDNDEDGLVDCDDTDCAAISRCRDRENCLDGVDNDFDGRIDCEDRDCGGVHPCPPLELCDSGTDEDGDGLVDCEDPSCESQPSCGLVEQGFDLVIVSEGYFREDVEGDGEGAGTNGDDEQNVVEVAFESETVIEAVVYVVPFPGPQPQGVQGWALSIRHNRDVMDLDGTPTIDGTDAGDLIDGGFESTERADSEDGADGQGAGQDGEDEGDGYVSAVVLAFSQPITLDPTRAQSISRATYHLRDDLGTPELGPGTIRFENGLRGSGQPVNNVLTIESTSVSPIHLISLEARRVGPGGSFVRGDANDDGRVDLSDAIWIINYLVRGGPPTACRRAVDVNDDGRHDLSDPIYLVQYRFLGGAVIPSPYPDCGKDRRQTDSNCPEGAMSTCSG